jgi:hypothetical protein
MDMSATATTPGLAAGVPDPPPALTRRIEEAIGALHAGQSLATASADTLLLAAERLFESMLRDGCIGRTSALELLVVDALVTYAFERASDDPEQIESKAERAMLTLAAFPRAGDTSVTG